MPARVSHSLLDPLLTGPLKALYPRLAIPPTFPPEGIVLIGHCCAILGAIGFACCSRWWWGGVLAALGVALNHLADVFDGTHARATNQCRNGGELLDHFIDPLSFSYWIAGLAYAADCLLLGIGGVIVVYATAVLTNIKAKMVGEFTLARFGPTEFKTLLVAFALFMATIVGEWWLATYSAPTFAFWFVLVMFLAGLVQLKISLWRAIREVNERGAAPDTTEWKLEG